MILSMLLHIELFGDLLSLLLFSLYMNIDQSEMQLLYLKSATLNESGSLFM